MRHLFINFSALLLAFTLDLKYSVPALAQDTVLKGYVQEQRAQVHENSLQGQVVDATSGMPIPHAEVTLPDQGYSMTTDSEGRYTLPRFLGKQAIILNIRKSGYAPLSATVQENAPPLFKLSLTRLKQGLILDQTLHHLGDDGYSPYSSDATVFRKQAEGPVLRIPFSLQGLSVQANPTLQIGSIIGLDTAMAHFVSNNPLPYAASPFLVKLNGQLIARIQVNGDNQQIQIPRAYLRLDGPNVLELETGSRTTRQGKLDYDDMELVNVVLHL